MMQHDMIKVSHWILVGPLQNNTTQDQNEIPKLQNYDGNLSHLHNTKSPTVPVPVRKVFPPLSRV